jgi:hypothetical protein
MLLDRRARFLYRHHDGGYLRALACATEYGLLLRLGVVLGAAMLARLILTSDYVRPTLGF